MTQDITQWLYQHNLGKVRSTKTKRPFTVIYSETLNSRSEARQREKYLKTAAGRRFMAKIIARESETPEIGGSPPD